VWELIKVVLLLLLYPGEAWDFISSYL